MIDCLKPSTLPISHLNAYKDCPLPAASSRAKKNNVQLLKRPQHLPQVPLEMLVGNQVITKLLFSFGIHQDSAPGGPFAVLTSIFRFDEIGDMQKMGDYLKNI